MWLANQDYTSEFLNWYSHRLDNKVLPTFATEAQYPQDWVATFRWTAFPTIRTSWELIKNQLENIYDKGTTIPIISMRYVPSGNSDWPSVVEVRLVNPLKVMKYVPGRTDERTKIAYDAVLYQLTRIENEIESLKKLILNDLSSQPPYEEGRLITEEEAAEWHNQAALEG